MKLKIKKTILIAGQFLNPGTTFEATAFQASDLIARGCAELAVADSVEPSEPKPKRAKKPDADVA
jgi:hypothetical protein